MDARSLRTEHVCGELQALNVTCVLIGSAPQSPAAAAAAAALWKKLAAEAAAAAAAELLPVGQTRHQHAVNLQRPRREAHQARIVEPSSSGLDTAPIQRRHA